MTLGGVQQGIPLAIALRFAAQTALGAAKIVLATGKHPAILRDEVCLKRLMDDGLFHLES